MQDNPPFRLPINHSLHYANIVQGERKSKGKTKFSTLILPSRSLYYQNIVQGERKSKGKTKFSTLILPSRSLYYQNIVQGERKSKGKTKFSTLILPSRSHSPQQRPTTFSNDKPPHARHRSFSPSSACRPTIPCNGNPAQAQNKYPTAHGHYWPSSDG